MEKEKRKKGREKKKKEKKVYYDYAWTLPALSIAFCF